MSISVWKFTSLTGSYTDKYAPSLNAGTYLYTDIACTSPWVMWMVCNGYTVGQGYYDYLRNNALTAMWPVGPLFPTNQNHTAHLPESTYYSAVVSGTPLFTSAAAALTLYSRTAVAGTGGTVSTSGARYAETGTFTATATPAANYVFTKWTNGGVDYSTSNPVTIARSEAADTDLTAVFRSTKHTMTLAINNAAYGAVELYVNGVKKTTLSNVSVYEGQTVRVVGTPAYNAVFSNWSGGDIAGATQTDVSFTVTESTATTFTVTGVFSLLTSTILTLAKDAAAGGTVELYRIDEATGTAIAVGADTGTGIAATVYVGLLYRVVAVLSQAGTHTYGGWQYNGSTLTASATYTFRLSLTSPITLTALFTARPQVTLDLDVSGLTSGNVRLWAFGPDWSYSPGVSDGTATLAGSWYTDEQIGFRIENRDAELFTFTGWFDGSNNLISSSPSYNVPLSTTGTLAYTAKFVARTTYSITLTVSNTNGASTAGNAIVQEPDDADLEGEFLSGRVFAITARPVAGWKIAGWTVNCSDDNYDLTLPAVGQACPQTFNFTLFGDTTITAVFEKLPFEVAIEYGVPTLPGVPANTADHSLYGTAKLQTKADEFTWIDATSPIEYGESVRVYIEPATGYGVYRVYDGTTSLTLYEEGVTAGVICADLGPLTSTHALLVSFTATVSLIIDSETPSSGAAIALDYAGTTILTGNESTAVEADLPCGWPIVLRATPVTGKVFAGWFLAADTGFEQPLLNLGAEATVDVTESVDYVARFEDAARTYYVAVLNDPTGAGTLTLDVPGLVVSSKSAFDLFFEGSAPSGVADSDLYYTIAGTASGTLTDVPVGNNFFRKWQYRVATLIPGDPVDTWEWTEYADLSTSASIPVSITRHVKYKALYYSGTPVRIGAAYRTGSDSTQGSAVFAPAGANGATVPGVIEAYDYRPGVSVTLTAVPSNGHKFLGWYSAATGGTLLAATQTYTFTVTAAATVYMSFAQDENAVYVWEGAGTPKQLTWRSKRYVSNVPFDPVCAKVYADGYPVTLNLYACSSPDSPSPLYPTQSVVLTDQGARRLASSRKEKYFEVEVLSQFPVSKIVFGTSMGGLGV